MIGFSIHQESADGWDSDLEIELSEHEQMPKPVGGSFL
jgi:hypothetical protein